MGSSIGLIFISVINSIFLACLVYELVKIRKMMEAKRDQG